MHMNVMLISCNGCAHMSFLQLHHNETLSGRGGGGRAGRPRYVSPPTQKQLKKIFKKFYKVACENSSHLAINACPHVPTPPLKNTTKQQYPPIELCYMPSKTHCLNAFVIGYTSRLRITFLLLVNYRIHFTIIWLGILCQ